MSNSTVKVRFLDSLSCGAGSWGFGQIDTIPSVLAEPWLKTGQVEYATKEEEARVAKAKAEAIKPAEKDTKGKAQVAPVVDDLS